LLAVVAASVFAGACGGRASISQLLDDADAAVPDASCEAQHDCTKQADGAHLDCEADSDCTPVETWCTGACDATCIVPRCDRQSGRCYADPLPDGTTCSLDDSCTAGAECAAGICEGRLFIDCNDDDPCTDDSCVNLYGCVHTAQSCDDGLDCTDDGCLGASGCAHRVQTGHAIVDGVCQLGGENDPGPCKAVEQGFLIDLPDGTPCDDEDACTSNTLCDAGECTGGGVVQCADSDPTTTDSCSALSGCLHDKTCDDFQVNQIATGDQGVPRAVGFAGGGGVVAWETGNSATQWGISLRLFDASGSFTDEATVRPLGPATVGSGVWVGLLGVVNVGSDRFAVLWNAGEDAQGVFRIYNRSGQPLTNRLSLPTPLLPEPLEANQTLLSYRVVAGHPDGFVVLMDNSTNPASATNHAVYLYRYDRTGALVTGPVKTTDASSPSVLVADGAGDVRAYMGGGYGSIRSVRFDGTTLTAQSSSVIDMPAPGYTNVHSVAPTPWGSVIAASQPYDGSWVVWVDTDDARTATTTIETIGPDSTQFHMAVAARADGRVLVGYSRADSTNGIGAYRFVGPDRPIAGTFSIDCSGTAYSATPVLVAANDAKVLVLWQSFVSDGDAGSIRGRFVDW
jgi:hypothetical protein